MICLYTYRLDKKDGIELKYSIRSMVKHFTDFDDILLVGDKPLWYTGPYIQHTDTSKPALNIANKILASGIIGDFLWCADDHFALKPFGADLPNYYSGTVQQNIAKQGDADIKRVLRTCPKGWLSFMVHCPMVMNMDKFKQCVIGEYPIKTMYVNYHKLLATSGIDCKIRGELKYQQIKKRIHGMNFFSTHEGAINDDMLRILNELYPLPSQYE